MNKYKNNLKALDNLRKINKKITEIDIIIQNKYQFNKKRSENTKHILDNSMDKYHNIIKNLDVFLS